MTTENPRLSLVVTSIGRAPEFARLIRSVAASEHAPSIEVVLVDQSEDQRCARLLQREHLPGPWQVAQSGRGASVGRNVGIRLARGDLIAFPNDNSWYPPHALARTVRFLDARPDAGAVSGRLLTADGVPSLLRWRRQACSVTRQNFLQTTICSTICVRRSVIDQVGLFNEGLGTGSSGWFGSGEESDLVLRILAAGFEFAYEPEIVTFHHDDRAAPTEAFVGKMLRYGCGHGRVWRMHELSAAHLGYLGARKIVRAACRAGSGQFLLARADIAYARGMLAGWRGVQP